MSQHTLDAEALAKLILTRIGDSPYCVRVLHGRGKQYAGLELANIEWYPPYLLVQNFDTALSSELTEALDTVFQKHASIEAILVQSRTWPDFITEISHSRQKVELPIVMQAPLSEDVECEVKLGANRNTGVFLDMRAGWSWVAENAKNKRVLNLFSYTGVFSLFALSGEASRVDNVDMAANVLKIAQRNHQYNELHDGKAAFFKRDILKSQRWFEGREPYDLIIIDPPPYQKKAFRGWQDYLKLLDHCKIALASGGTMLCVLNNPQVSIDEFRHDLDQHFDTMKQSEIIARATEIEELDPARGLKIVALHF